MTGHGGYWTRLEFEKAPFFDIYDPETEPWYPAPLHTDLRPLIEGQKKVAWLRPQMYESVPYERWRYHVFVELMRGARGWQIAHGPGDASLMRGLHAELKHLQPAIYSKEKPAAVTEGRISRNFFDADPAFAFGAAPSHTKLAPSRGGSGLSGRRLMASRR